MKQKKYETYHIRIKVSSKVKPAEFNISNMSSE